MKAPILPLLSRTVLSDDVAHGLAGAFWMGVCTLASESSSVPPTVD